MNLVKDFKKVFGNSRIEPPRLKLGSAYSWPTFDITFFSKEDLEFAETSGLIKQFKQKIRMRLPKDFDPDRAVYCKYVLLKKKQT